MLKSIVTEELHNLGMPAHIKGYEYTRKAIMLVIQDRSNINCVTKGLYPKVAKSFDTTPTRVERAIRHAIGIAWDRGSIDNLNNMFKYTIRADKGKPTNSEFIAMVADKITIDIERGYNGIEGPKDM